MGSRALCVQLNLNFWDWVLESAFVTSFPDARSGFRATDLTKPLNFPDGETEAHGGEGTQPQSRGCRRAKPGLLMLPA